MDDTKLKYIRLKEYDSVIIFPMIIEHIKFKNMNPISAGFCYVEENKVTCFGESFSLDLKSLSNDTEMATKQVFGFDAMLAL